MSTQDVAEIPFRTLARGHGNTNSGGGLFFCRNQQTWAAKWRGLHYRQLPEPPLPHVDWAIEMVALLVCGTRPSGGHHLTIKSIGVHGAWVEVRAVERRPGRGAVTTAALTNPYHAVAIRGHDGAERLLLQIEYNHYEQ
jgi:hypothetical protein